MPRPHGSRSLGLAAAARSAPPRPQRSVAVSSRLPHGQLASGSQGPLAPGTRGPLPLRPPRASRGKAARQRRERGSALRAASAPTPSPPPGVSRGSRRGAGGEGGTAHPRPAPREKGEKLKSKGKLVQSGSSVLDAFHPLFTLSARWQQSDWNSQDRACGESCIIAAAKPSESSAVRKLPLLALLLETAEPLRFSASRPRASVIHKNISPPCMQCT